MADVYLAVAQGPARFNKLVVLKCLRKRWLEDEQGEDGMRTEQTEFIEMFLEEARLAARLNHPNIVQTNEVGDESGDYYIAMEYLEGQSLNRIMNRAWRKDRDVPLELAILVLCDSLAGLHHAHELRDFDGRALQLVHRDASPHNIFVTYEGQTKLVDFGIAKATTRSFETRTGVLKGKIQYMAPEQARCAEVDRRADIFSIGVVLWELVARKRMWAGMADIQILQHLVSEPVPRIREVAPNVPEGLAVIIDRATAFDQNDRFFTAEEMRQELYDWSRVHLPQCTAKEIGTITAELFADKRALVASIIENQFVQIRRGQDINLNVIDSPTSVSLPKTADTTETEGSNPSHSSAAGRTATPQTMSNLAASQPGFSIAEPRKKRTGLWVGAGVVAVAGIGAAVALSASSSSKPDVGSTQRPASSTVSATSVASASTPAPLASSAAAVPVSSTEDQANVTKLTVRAKPADAKIFVDDTAVSSNPYVGPFKRDGLNHRIRAEADGYTSEKKLVVFDDGSKEVEFDLAPKNTGARPIYPVKTSPSPPVTPTPTPVVAAPQPDPPDPPTKGPGKPPKRVLDPTDPYATAKP